MSGASFLRGTSPVGISNLSFNSGVRFTPPTNQTFTSSPSQQIATSPNANLGFSSNSSFQVTPPASPPGPSSPPLINQTFTLPRQPGTTVTPGRNSVHITNQQNPSSVGNTVVFEQNGRNSSLNVSGVSPINSNNPSGPTFNYGVSLNGSFTGQPTPGANTENRNVSVSGGYNTNTVTPNGGNNTAVNVTVSGGQIGTTFPLPSLGINGTSHTNNLSVQAGAAFSTYGAVTPDNTRNESHLGVNGRVTVSNTNVIVPGHGNVQSGTKEVGLGVSYFQGPTVGPFGNNGQGGSPVGGAFRVGANLNLINGSDINGQRLPTSVSGDINATLHINRNTSITGTAGVNPTDGSFVRFTGRTEW